MTLLYPPPSCIWPKKKMLPFQYWPINYNICIKISSLPPYIFQKLTYFLQTCTHQQWTNIQNETKQNASLDLTRLSGRKRDRFGIRFAVLQFLRQRTKLNVTTSVHLLMILQKKDQIHMIIRDYLLPFHFFVELLCSLYCTDLHSPGKGHLLKKRLTHPDLSRPKKVTFKTIRLAPLPLFVDKGLEPCFPS